MASIKTATPGPDLIEDSNHFKIHAAVARLYERKGNYVQALSGYRMNIAVKYDRAAIRVRVARLYNMRRGKWKNSMPTRACRTSIDSRGHVAHRAPVTFPAVVY